MKTNILALTLLALVVGCGPKKQPNIEIVQNMMESPAYKTQEGDPNSPNGSSMRLPPDGTIPRGYKPYPAHLVDSTLAEKELSNPVAVSELSLKRGQQLYFTYCSVCHGSLGKGDGTVAAKWPVPVPPLVSDRVKAWKDGGFYHMIVMGRGMMGSYAGQIPDPTDRWSLVNYIRELQKNPDAAKKN